MKSREQLKAEVAKEQRIQSRLSLARTRLEDAQREQIWAIAAAHSDGLSIRKIAAVMGLSSSRVHQLFQSDEAHQIPAWLNSPDPLDDINAGDPLDEYPPAETVRRQQLADEVELLRQCIEWLEQLARGERVVINLRADCDPKTAYVSVNQTWVLRVLKRISADLDSWSGFRQPSTRKNNDSDVISAGVEHRRRLGEPELQWSSLSQREQREILREKMGRSPF